MGVGRLQTKGNPWDIPEWHSLQREAKLIRHMVGSGVTALGRANYADKSGDYYTAFFGLSVGLERLAKLILVADYSISNSGRMPEEKVVRKFGHRLGDLFDAVEVISQSRNLSLGHHRPNSTICTKIIECLDSFADAGRGRYANFAALGDPNLSQDEPIEKWWGEVAETILDSHYYGKLAQKRVEARAQALDQMMSPVTVVVYIDEKRAPMQDVLTASIRTGQTEIVQRFGRFYTLTVVRWLAELLSKLSELACYDNNVDAFYGVWEHFRTYTVDDSLLRSRKNWPLT